ncbi:hypothetical protein [Nocardioides sp. NPDC047086]|uniref:hypothetical protein n=1 Tax=Nocardioides sp. NPDC047086 TaxID=3154810 RepID=UPI0033FC3AB1
MRTTQNRRRLAAGAIALAAMSTFVACGSEGSAESDPTGSDAAPAIDPGTKLSEDEAEKLIDSAVDAMPTVHVEIGVKAVEDGVSVNAATVGDYQSEPVAYQTQLTAEQDGTETVMEIIAVGETTYLRMDDDKEWMEDDGMLSGMVAALMPNPFTLVDAVRDEVGDDSTTYVGQEEVDGADLAHYTFAVGEDITGEDAGDLEGWFDAKGRLTRLSLPMDEGNEINVDLTKHGEKVTITEPAAEELMDGA